MVLLAVSGCRKAGMLEVMEPEASDPTISFSPSVSSLEVRALVNDKTSGYFQSFEDACRDHVNHILLFSEQVDKEDDGSLTSHYEIFQTDKSISTWICYAKNLEGNYAWMLDTDRKDEYDNPIVTKDRPWGGKGSVYEFMALYPATLERDIYRGLTESETESMSLSYNTHSRQDDVLVAYNEVNTKDPVTGEPSLFVDSGGNRSTVSSGTGGEYASESAAKYSFSNKFDLAKPVPLRFRHVMAAVRLHFHLDYYRSKPDQLLETWFENTDEGGFHTIGTLLYGIGSRPDDAVGDPGRYRQKDNFTWNTYQTSYDDSEIYKWSVKQADGKYYSEEKISDDDVRATVMTESGGIRTYTTTIKVKGGDLVVVTTRDADNNVSVAVPTLNGEKLTTLMFRSNKGVDGKWTEVVDFVPDATVDASGVISVTGYRVSLDETTSRNDRATVHKINFTIAESNGAGGEIVCTTSGTHREGYGESFYYTGTENIGNALSYADIPGLSPESEMFVDNNNTLLIIPQESPGKVRCCFRLHSSENEAAFVTIPVFTGTAYDEATGEMIECPAADRENQLSLANTIYNDYCPGYVYTYTIHIARSTSYLNVQVTPWNEMHSSADIIF